MWGPAGAVCGETVAATRDLADQVKTGAFREDLFYRLRVARLRVPPLRERLDDIPLLINSINASESDRMNRPAPVYTDDAIDFLRGYNWPGNVRELKNVIERSMILSTPPKLEIHEGVGDAEAPTGVNRCRPRSAESSWAAITPRTLLPCGSSGGLMMPRPS